MIRLTATLLALVAISILPINDRAYATSYGLSVTINGDAGSVNSVPSGPISCTSPPQSGICSSTLPAGTPLQLVATPGTGSFFAGWSDSCSNCFGTVCPVILDAPKNCAVIFSSLPPVMIKSTPAVYSSALQDAFNTSPVGATIQSRDISFNEDLIVSRAIPFLLRGGFDATFSAQPGYSTVNGKLVIRSGTVVADRVVVSGTAPSPVVTSIEIPGMLSLTVGESFSLYTSSSPPLKYVSDNPAVRVDDTGVLYADSDVADEKGRATITVSQADGTVVAKSAVTVVDWVANRSSLVTVAHPAGADNIVLVDGDSVYFTSGTQLLVSNDGMQTSVTKGTLPDTLPTRLLKTPYGYFLRTGLGVYRSSDLTNWSKELTVRSGSLYHMFTYYYDAATKVCYVYTGEYSVVTTDKHAVYRGTYSPDSTVEWKNILEFDSLSNFNISQDGLGFARHVHVVEVDPYTGQVWVGTGDSDLHSRIMYSDDHGDSFRIVGIGDQMWRTLSIWFTDTHVYWNMDSEVVAQSIWRIPRSVYAVGSMWPDMAPELSSGTTTVGRKYLVTAMYDPGRFPVNRGYSYTESQKRVLGDNDRVLSVNDPSLQYFEQVAKLDNGSQWFHCWATDAAGNKILLMGASPEGAIRDWNGRVFGIKERPGAKPDVQELFSTVSYKPDTYFPYTQLEPRGQTGSGDIYFVGRGTPYRIYKMRLNWKDQ